VYRGRRRKKSRIVSGGEVIKVTVRKIMQSRISRQCYEKWRQHITSRGKKSKNDPRDPNGASRLGRAEQ
jgi:hypothetical protein